MTEWMLKKLYAAEDGQLSKRVNLCPRCGRNYLRLDGTDSRSKQYEPLFICESCVKNERDMETMNRPIPMCDWHGAVHPINPPFSFSPYTAEESYSIIDKKYSGVLNRFYRVMKDSPDDKLELCCELEEVCPEARLVQFSNDLRVVFYVSDGCAVATRDENGLRFGKAQRC